MAQEKNDSFTAGIYLSSIGKDYINQVRREAGVTQSQIADFMRKNGVTCSQAKVSDWLAGNRQNRIQAEALPLLYRLFNEDHRLYFLISPRDKSSSVYISSSEREVTEIEQQGIIGRALSIFSSYNSRASRIYSQYNDTQKGQFLVEYHEFLKKHEDQLSQRRNPCQLKEDITDRLGE